MSDKDREWEIKGYDSVSLSNDVPGWRGWSAKVGAIVGEIPYPGNERQRDEVCIMQRFMHHLPFSAQPPLFSFAAAYLGVHPRIN